MLSSIALVGKELGRVGLDRALPDGRTLPDRGPDITPAVLERVTGRPSGSITAVQVLDEHHGTAGRIHLAVEATSAAELPDTIFVKCTPRHPVQRVMMSVFELGARELLFYESVADDVPLRVPHCYGLDHHRRRGRNLLVLEDLGATARFRDIREPATADEAAAVVDALAALHGAFWGSPRLTGDLAALSARSPAAERLGNLFVKSVLGKRKGRSAEVIPADVARAGRMMFEQRAAIDAFWAREAQTLCHGDTHLGNLFFEGPRPGFLDWQAAMVGPGLRDVSYFLIASVDPHVLTPIESDLVDRYVGRLAEHGVVLDRAWAWNRYRASAAEIYVAAVVTAGTADRMQPAEISSVGVDRAVTAVQRLDTFAILGRLAGADITSAGRP